jgi:uncharacterized protein (TIGR03067 family)
LVLNKNTYVTYRENRPIMKGRYRVDPAQTPREIDIIATTGENEGKTLKGIYRLEKDTLTLCYIVPDKDRPTQFKSEPGSGVTLTVWKRAP